MESLCSHNLSRHECSNVQRALTNTFSPRGGRWPTPVRVDGSATKPIAPHEDAASMHEESWVRHAAPAVHYRGNPFSPNSHSSQPRLSSTRRTLRMYRPRPALPHHGDGIPRAE